MSQIDKPIESDKNMSDAIQALDKIRGVDLLQSKVEMYKVYLEQSRHAENLFFNFSKHFTTIIVLLLSSTGAILAAVNMGDSEKRILATFLIGLAGFVSVLACLVVRGMGEYVSNFVNRRNILERDIGSLLGDQELTGIIEKAQEDRALVRHKLLSLFVAFAVASLVLALVVWNHYQPA